MSLFSHQIYKKVNAQYVKDLPIFIVLTVVMSGYVLTIGCSIKEIITINDNKKRLLVIILVEAIFKVLLVTLLPLTTCHWKLYYQSYAVLYLYI